MLPSVGTEYSDMKLCLLRDVDKQTREHKTSESVHAQVLFVQLNTHCSVLLFIV